MPESVKLELSTCEGKLLKRGGRENDGAEGNEIGDGVRLSMGHLRRSHWCVIIRTQTELMPWEFQ